MKQLLLGIIVLFSLTLSAQWSSNTALNTLVAGVNTDDMMSAATTDGRMMRSSTRSASRVTWSTSGIPAGIYIIRAVDTKGNLFTRRLQII